MDFIETYFKNEIEFPNPLAGEILPFGTLYSEVSTSFLDAFINSVSCHLFCYVLDYYNTFEDKSVMVNEINNGDYKPTHTKFNKLDDDIMIVSQVKFGGYIYFWYHMSGWCDIGRFKTLESMKEIEKRFTTFLDGMKKDNSITGYTKLNTNFIRGTAGF